MNRGSSLQPEQLQLELQDIATVVRALAKSRQGNSLELLALLRQLEELHREIRDGMFLAALPNNRQALYAFLKDVESEGGWPYIERMKLQSFLENLQLEIEESGDRARGESLSKEIDPTLSTE